MLRTTTTDVDRWKIMIASEMTRQRSIPTADTFLRRHSTWTRPADLLCDDGEEYCVKALPRSNHPFAKDPKFQIARTMVTDQVVGKIGVRLKAPVAEVAVVNVPQDLINLNWEMEHMQSGLAHASKIIKGCSDIRSVRNDRDGDNRARLALLAILYGWMQSDDQQLLIENVYPHKIHSADHGWFLAGGRYWSEASLKSADLPRIDEWLDRRCDFTASELQNAARNLDLVDDVSILEAVVAPPAEWGITFDERVALAVYISSRRNSLLMSINKKI